ncbi:MAG: VOC family protein, partial [Kiritimatiellia bacterium]
YKNLGFTELHREEVLGRHQVREVLLQIGKGPNLIQLLEPLSPESPVAKQLERNGGRGGFAHLAFRVKDIHAAYKLMKERGFNLTQEPGAGSRGTMIFFVHPKDFSFLIEVVQEGAAPHA